MGETIIYSIGDTTIDYHIRYVNEDKPGVKFATKSTIETYRQLGGAGFTNSLLKYLKSENLIENVTLNEFKFHLNFPTSYSLISEKITDKDRIWRIEKFIGLEHKKKGDPKIFLQGVNESVQPDVLLIHDYRNYFWDENELIGNYINSHSQTKLKILRLGNFYSKNKEEQSDQINKSILNIVDNKEDLITFISINDIRDEEIQISQGLSWEKTSTDLINCIGKGGSLEHIVCSQFTVIVIDRYGALIIDKSNKKRTTYNLVYNPLQIEGIRDLQDDGEMYGRISCIIVYVLLDLIHNGYKLEIKPIISGIKKGLSKTEEVYKSGFTIGKLRLKDELIFPVELLRTNNYRWNSDFNDVPLALSKSDADKISVDGILQTKKDPDIQQIAIDTVVYGWEYSLSKDIPIAQFGDLIVVDREEIEQYRDFKKMMINHINNPQKKRPLSFAVLGDPGCGKSFAIKEIFRTIEITNKNIGTMEFNLTQFKSRDDLISAFDLIRDSTLEGKQVLVIWDEVDTEYDVSQQYGWIKYFLAPMQDGKYFNGPIPRPIGCPIFVFASSNKSTWKDFVEITKSDMSSKLPDFISRLHGHIDIKGINYPKGKKTDDPYKTIKRAILMRAILRKYYPSIFTINNTQKSNHKDLEIAHIDTQILTAFLKDICTFRYGTRSFESILQMSQLSGKKTFSQSCLPSIDQLGIHIEADDLRPFIEMANNRTPRYNAEDYE